MCHHHDHQKRKKNLNHLNLGLVEIGLVVFGGMKVGFVVFGVVKDGLVVFGVVKDGLVVFGVVKVGLVLFGVVKAVEVVVKAVVGEVVKAVHHPVPLPPLNASKHHSQVLCNQDLQRVQTKESLLCSPSLVCNPRRFSCSSRRSLSEHQSLPTMEASNQIPSSEI